MSEQPTRKKRGVHPVGAVIVGFIVFLWIASSGPQTQRSADGVRVVSEEVTPGGTKVTTLATAPIPAPVKAISVTAEKIDSEYDENELAAQAKYAEFNAITISGTVHSVDVVFGTTSVALSTSGLGVQLRLKEESLGKAKDLRRGQKVSATCRGISKAISPAAKDCVLN